MNEPENVLKKKLAACVVAKSNLSVQTPSAPLFSHGGKAPILASSSLFSDWIVRV